jgi:hypothetical protein
METFTIYRHETVTSVTEIEAESPEQALKYARVADGMPNGPEFGEYERRNKRYSLESLSVTAETTVVEETEKEVKVGRLPFKKKVAE